MNNSFFISTLVIFSLTWVVSILFVFFSANRLTQVKKFLNFQEKIFFSKKYFAWFIFFIVISCLLIPIIIISLSIIYFINVSSIISYIESSFIIFDLILFIIFFIKVNNWRMNIFIIKTKDNIIFSDLIIDNNHFINATYNKSLKNIFVNYYDKQNNKNSYCFNYSWELKDFFNAIEE